MNFILRISLIFVVAVALACALLEPKPQQSFGSQAKSKPQSSALSRCPRAKDFAIRLMYAPRDADHTPYPRIFKQVEPRDLNFGCWSFEWPSGTMVFVGAPDMLAFAEGLAKLNLKWQEFPKFMSFNAEPAEPGSPVRYKVPGPRGEGLQVDVSCDVASATAELPLERMCADMPSLERAFESLRGRYSIQVIEWEAHCQVPGFDPHRLPEK